MEERDYVRTKHFGINKIKGFYSDVHYDYIMVNDDLIKKEDIIKSSPNIIDLIEVGDYVNGYYVDKITDIDTGLPVLCNFDLNVMEWTPLENIDVWYSIVTKEQFESMEYKVGD